MESSQIPDRLLAGLVARPPLAALAAAFLRAAGPLAFFGAQALYVSQPALSAFMSADDIGALARVLEDPAQTQRLVDRLEGLSA